MLSRMIPRSMGSASHQLLIAFVRGCPPVLMTCRRGWELTSCCSTPTKTEVLWISSPWHQYLIPTEAVHISNTSVLPICSVRDLGVYIDADTAIKSHVTATIKVCFAARRQIHSVLHSLPQDASLTLISVLMVNKVDYCNSVLASISGRLVDSLQSILNAAVRLVFSVKKSEPILPQLREIHWLRVPERIQFRLCVVLYRCLQGTAPPYLAESLHRTTEVTVSCHLRSADTSSLLVPSTRRATNGDCTISVAAPRLWKNPAYFSSNCCVFDDFTAWTQDIVIWIVNRLTYLHIVYPYINCFWTLNKMR